MAMIYDLPPLQEVTENWNMGAMEMQAPVCCGVDAKFIQGVRIPRGFNPSSTFSLPPSQLCASHLLVGIAVSALLAVLTSCPSSKSAAPVCVPESRQRTEP